MIFRDELLKIYELLHGYFGDLHWWPADSPFEVMVGAILTQNTAWTNVEKAISALKNKNLLSPEALCCGSMKPAWPRSSDRPVIIM